MNKQTIITILLTLVAMAGQGQNWSPLVEDSIDFIITGTTNSTQDSLIFYKNSLKLVSEFHPRHPIFGFVGGFFVGLSVTLWLGMTLGGGYSMA